MITTEAEWFACQDPDQLLELASQRVPDSRFRWLAAAWSERMSHLLNGYDREWLEGFNTWVNGEGPYPSESPESRECEFDGFPRRYSVDSCADWIRRKEYAKAAVTAAEAVAGDYQWAPLPELDYTHQHRARSAKKRAVEQDQVRANSAMHDALRERNRIQIRWEFCEQFRDVAGNPLRGVLLSQDHRTAEVVALAREIHARGWFDQMPLLADALEAAGCQCAPLLEHCREPWQHVRGCWAIHLICGEN
ncbi:MAG: hypothetical protein ACRC8S_22115 [Fimbriiglobus sp.]